MGRTGRVAMSLFVRVEGLSLVDEGWIGTRDRPSAPFNPPNMAQAGVSRAGRAAPPRASIRPICSGRRWSPCSTPPLRRISRLTMRARRKCVASQTRPWGDLHRLNSISYCCNEMRSRHSVARHATPEIDVSGIAARHSRVPSSTMFRMRNRRPLASARHGQNPPTSGRSAWIQPGSAPAIPPRGAEPVACARLGHLRDKCG